MQHNFLRYIILDDLTEEVSNFNLNLCLELYPSSNNKKETIDACRAYTFICQDTTDTFIFTLERRLNLKGALDVLEFRIFVSLNFDETLCC